MRIYTIDYMAPKTITRKNKLASTSNFDQVTLNKSQGLGPRLMSLVCTPNYDEETLDPMEVDRGR